MIWTLVVSTSTACSGSSVHGRCLPGLRGPLHQPQDDESLDFLLENKNTVILNKEVTWPYKAILGRTVDPNFALYCERNADNIKIGTKALTSIKKRHNTEGYYFFTRNEKHLMLAKIALGGSITKIIKFVSDKELHK